MRERIVYVDDDADSSVNLGELRDDRQILRNRQPDAAVLFRHEQAEDARALEDRPDLLVWKPFLVLDLLLEGIEFAPDGFEDRLSQLRVISPGRDLPLFIRLHVSLARLV